MKEGEVDARECSGKGDSAQQQKTRRPVTEEDKRVRQWSARCSNLPGTGVAWGFLAANLGPVLVHLRPAPTFPSAD